MARKVSERMRKTLEALEVYENTLYPGASSYEVEISGGSRSCLYSAIRKGWASSYGKTAYPGPGEDLRTVRYYRTQDGTAALKEAQS